MFENILLLIIAALIFSVRGLLIECRARLDVNNILLVESANVSKERLDELKIQALK